MKSYFERDCRLCGSTILVGTDVARYMSEYVHVKCKLAAIKAAVDNGKVTIIPSVNVSMPYMGNGIRPKRTYGKQKSRQLA